MTRQVALGAIIGFAITVLVLAWWDRGARLEPMEALDAGAVAKPGALLLKDAVLTDLPAVRHQRPALLGFQAAVSDAGTGR